MWIREVKDLLRHSRQWVLLSSLQKSTQSVPSSSNGRVQVLTIEDTLGTADVYVTTGNKDVITLEHMEAMKDQAIVCNIDTLIMKPSRRSKHEQTSKRSTSNHKLTNLLSRMGYIPFGLWQARESRLCGHPSFVMSNSFTNQVLAQIDLGRIRTPMKTRCTFYPNILMRSCTTPFEKICCKLTTMSKTRQITSAYQQKALQTGALSVLISLFFI